ncbi:MAG: diguanylate cyclase [Rhodocyclaceae bacterium]|jgi:diguanylate cyclase (GGDEF)-like protein|nr:diguanylate cyclase [Rhodocyclaceae bacterium]
MIRRLPPLTIRQRLLMIGLVPAALVAAALTAYFLINGTRSLEAGLRERGLAIAGFAAPAAEYGVISGNRENLSGLLQAMLDQPQVTAAAVMDAGGRILAVSGRPKAMSFQHLKALTSAGILAESPDLLAVAAPVRGSPLEVDDLLAATSTTSATGPIGWVYVELDRLPLQERKASIIWTSLGLLSIALVITGWLAKRMGRTISIPIGRLAQAVSSMAHGNLDERVPTISGGELGALERGFNKMAGSLSEIHQDMQARINAATEQLSHQAHHDALTGLPNRRAFEASLETALEGALQRGETHALCFIDLDQFKIVNDTCGHGAGDELLQRISALLRQKVREGDLLSRTGGDEFALLLRDCSLEDARRVAEGLRQAVELFRFPWDGRRFSVGTSIGLVGIDRHTGSCAQVMAAADSACYRAKRQGRNQVVEHILYAPGAPQSQATLAAPLPATIDPERLEVFAQSVVPLGEQGLAGPWLELLLRVRNDQGALVPPQEFLEQWERMGVALEVDEWMAQQALSLTARLSGESEHAEAFMVSLNIGRGALVEPNRYCEFLRAALQRHGLRPSQVVVEIPADLAEQAPAESLGLVQTLRSLGCRTALDRFTGDNLGQLRSLRPDYVKIDCLRLHEDYAAEEAHGVIQAIASLAASQRIQTVAERVEAAECLAALPGLGVLYAQGYALAVPVPFLHWSAHLPAPTAQPPLAGQPE